MGEEQIQGYRLFRRQGDFSQPEFAQASLPAYWPSHLSIPQDQWEGVQTGWFYSVLGNGREQRPYGPNLQQLTGNNSALGQYLKDHVGHCMVALASASRS